MLSAKTIVLRPIHTEQRRVVHGGICEFWRMSVCPSVFVQNNLKIAERIQLIFVHKHYERLVD